MVPATSIKTILCDIEGTTTSISFVKVGLPAANTSATVVLCFTHTRTHTHTIIIFGDRKLPGSRRLTGAMYLFNFGFCFLIF